MGNEAIALGAARAGVSVVSGYPGTPSTEIIETLIREKIPGIEVQWSTNEKAALEVAAGAAYSGARSMVTMKQVGLNVAADPLMSLSYVGVEGGMVVVVADDPVLGPHRPSRIPGILQNIRTCPYLTRRRLKRRTRWSHMHSTSPRSSDCLSS
jgi:pyruvate/2-oxoacid:ferredoxin oxidoreductase alpha subunit